MTEPVTLALTAIGAGVAGVIAYLSLPSPPDLDAERWFKLMLVNLLHGEVEHGGGDVDAWVAAVKQQVPYHPAGRFVEKKVAGLPLLYDALPGEAALVEHLQALDTPIERYAYLFDEDEVGLAARLDDPVELGRDYAPKTWLGTAGWNDLVDWGGAKSTAFPDALGRRAAFTWVLVGAHPAGPNVLDALAAIVPDGLVVQDPATIWNTLQALPERKQDYTFVFVAVDVAVQDVLKMLATSADARGIRDRTAAVVACNPLFDDPWMASNFAHHPFDTEMDHLTPYMAWQWLDRAAEPAGAFGRSVASGRFPDVPVQAMTKDVLEPIDLGVLPHDSNPERVAQALYAFVSCWCIARMN